MKMQRSGCANIMMGTTRKEKRRDYYELEIKGKYTFYMTEQAFAAATGTADKELFLIEGATHIQTYYVPQYVNQAVDKLTEFYGKHL